MSPQMNTVVSNAEEDDVNPFELDIKRDYKRFYREEKFLSHSFNIPEHALDKLSDLMESEDDQFAVL